jgi:hypothetical protein
VPRSKKQLEEGGLTRAVIWPLIIAHIPLGVTTPFKTFDFF